MVGLDPHQHLVQQALLGLEPMCLVHHNVGPLHLLKERPVLDHHLVVGQEGVESDRTAAIIALVLAYDLARCRVAVVHDEVHFRGPLFELLLPGGHGGERDADEHGALEAGLEKTRVFLTKTQPSVLFGFFEFFGVFLYTLGFFKFQKYFKVHPDSY
jgi:hypothetical protein